MKTIKFPTVVWATYLAAISLLIDSVLGLPVAYGAENKPAGAAAPATSDAGPSDADYCTVLYSTKLQNDLQLSDDQREKVSELKDQLKAMLENAANPAAARGRSDARARTLGKRGGVVLANIGPSVKKLLSPEQERKMKELFAKGTLRPVEVVAAEAHGRTPSLNYVAIGKVGIICHYDEPAAKSSGANAPALGSVHGKGAEGSFYRDTHPSAPPPNQKRLTAEQLDAIVADLKSGDNKRIWDAAWKLVMKKPAAPNREVAGALESLLEDKDLIVRTRAAWALENWGTPESLPALKKALNDSARIVQGHAKNAIDKISAASASPQAGEKP